ncbi:MAG: AarF/ABC1/UbiB kinase family protein [Dehalococcoidales bacterium]|nr:AarF/ABC1/UbiB kinase family protein [Dehalococcoidales bacterium]
MTNAIQQPRKRPGHLTRYWQIIKILAKYRLEEVLGYVGLKKILIFRFLFRGNPFRKMPYSKPERMRMAIEELGTFFVKLGQILSTRTDLLPPAYTKELSKLQNSLKPVPAEIMKKVISNQLGHPIDELFPVFNPAPIGVASIGQVYACSLHDGTDVVVKVQKPGVPELVEEDMYILKQAAAAATKYWDGAQQYDLVGIAEEIADTIKEETDYIREGHSAEYFAEFFKNDNTIHIPKIHWEATTVRVLTMEKIKGIGIHDLQSLDKAGFDRKELAKRTVGLWLKMVFEGGAFHADPHPGNLFVEPDGRLGLVDFGMVYMVDDEVRWRLANTVKAILDRNVDMLIDALIELGAVNLRQEGSRASLRKDMKYVMSHYPTIHLQKHAESVSSNLDQLFTLLRRNRVQLPSNTFLLLKTIIMAQSMGRGLDPGFDITPMLQSYVMRLIKKKYSIMAAVRRMPAATAEMASLLGGLPTRLDRMFKTAERGEIQVRADVSGVEKHIDHLEKVINRTMLCVMIAAVIIGASLLFVGLRLGG